MLGVESFGEAEFWLALIKLVGLVAYFLFSLVYVGGGIQHGDLPRGPSVVINETPPLYHCKQICTYCCLRPTTTPRAYHLP